MKIAIGGGIVALVLVVVFSLVFRFTIVDAGERAVVTRFGPVVATLGEGFHWLTPFTDEAHVFNVQVQKEQADATAASKDQQDVFTTVAVNFLVDETAVDKLYTQIGKQYKEKVIDPAIQEVVKAVTAQYTAQELLSKRSEVGTKIRDGLVERLTPYYIKVSEVNIINFKYSNAYTNAIEAKVTAEQNALTAKNNLDAAQFEAQSIRVRSEAANNEKYIDLQRLEVEKAAIAKWNGQLPVQMIPGAALPFINLQTAR